MVLILPTETENWALVDPAGMSTDDGADSLPLLSAIVTPPLGAGFTRVTAHLSEVCDSNVAELHARPARAGAGGGGGGGGGASVIEKLWEVPFRLATRNAVVAALTVDAFTVNPALGEPAAMVTDDGIVMLPTAAPSPVVTVNPPAGAGTDALTVQVALPGVVTVAGAQVNALTR